MRFVGSRRAWIKLCLSLFVDRLARLSRRLDRWSLWLGVVITPIGIAVTFLHKLLPDHSLTEDCIAIIEAGVAIIEAGIRILHRWMYLSLGSLGDVMTYAGGVAFVLGVIASLARWFFHKGGTKSL
jgi:hypothetical protein